MSMLEQKQETMQQKPKKENEEIKKMERSDCKSFFISKYT